MRLSHSKGWVDGAHFDAPEIRNHKEFAHSKKKQGSWVDMDNI